MPHLSAIALMIALSAAAGRRFRRLVTQQIESAQRADPASPGSA